MANTRIIGVYSGTEPDNRGRYLHEIQQWPDEQLETVHDYIPWLFLLPERSGFNVAAPVLNPESIQEFRTRPDLRGNLRALSSATRNFYGLELCAGSANHGPPRAPNFATLKRQNGFLRGITIVCGSREFLRCLMRTGTGTRGKSVFRL